MKRKKIKRKYKNREKGTNEKRSTALTKGCDKSTIKEQESTKEQPLE